MILQPEDNWLDRKDKQVLQDLKSIFDELELPMLLVGAGARLIIVVKHKTSVISWRFYNKV